MHYPETYEIQLTTTISKRGFAAKPFQVCYLDFDGVLHHEAVYCSPKSGLFIRSPGRQFFEWMPILEQLIAPYPDVQIVLSTSWVQARSFAFARKHLSPMLQARVIGATFHNRFMRRGDFLANSRGIQIWNDVYRREPAAWFAIDDDDFGWPKWCRDKLVKTDGEIGLSDPIAQNAVRQMLMSW